MISDSVTFAECMRSWHRHPRAIRHAFYADSKHIISSPITLTTSTSHPARVLRSKHIISSPITLTQRYVVTTCMSSITSGASPTTPQSVFQSVLSSCTRYPRWPSKLGFHTRALFSSTSQWGQDRWVYSRFGDKVWKGCCSQLAMMPNSPLELARAHTNSRCHGCARAC
jgi:hypothetical protein